MPTQLSPGDDLWMLATGAGVGPYLSILREGHIQEAFRHLVLVHSVRRAAELAYHDEILQHQVSLPGRLHYVRIVTREPGAGSIQCRIPQAIEDGILQAHVSLPLDVSHSRVMVCGNPGFTADMRQLLAGHSFQPCRRNLIGSMLFENYW